MDERAKNIIPLFPLEVTLLPSSSIRLHIFENRYKQMISDVSEANSGFGIALQLEGKLHSTGTFAIITKIEREYPDGRKDILVKGGDRFLIQNLFDSGKPYMRAEVEFLFDKNDIPDASLKEETISLYLNLMEIVYKNSIDTDFVNSSVDILSFRMAEKIGMTLIQRQRLLEIFSETKRLKMIRDYLNEIIPKIEDFNSIQNIVKNDGYL